MEGMVARSRKVEGFARVEPEVPDRTVNTPPPPRPVVNLPVPSETDLEDDAPASPAPAPAVGRDAVPQAAAPVVGQVQDGEPRRRTTLSLTVESARLVQAEQDRSHEVKATILDGCVRDFELQFREGRAQPPSRQYGAGVIASLGVLFRESQLERIDALAKELGTSRSTLIRAAVEATLGRR
jgi:hypothetical protein